MEHSDLAKVRYMAMGYSMGGIWESNPEEKIMFDNILLKFKPYLFATKNETPEEIVTELIPSVNNMLDNMHTHKNRQSKEIIPDNGFTDMCISMYEPEAVGDR